MAIVLTLANLALFWFWKSFSPKQRWISIGISIPFWIILSRLSYELEIFNQMQANILAFLILVIFPALLIFKSWRLRSNKIRVLSLIGSTILFLLLSVSFASFILYFQDDREVVAKFESHDGYSYVIREADRSWLESYHCLSMNQYKRVMPGLLFQITVFEQDSADYRSSDGSRLFGCARNGSGRSVVPAIKQKFHAKD